MCAIGILLVAQTRVEPAQLKEQPSIAVVERQQCNVSGAGWDCRGLYAYRFKLSDGTTIGPLVGVADPAFVFDPAKWQQLPISVTQPGGTLVVGAQVR